MKKSKVSFCFLLLSFSIFKLSAQGIEFGVLLGASNYYGDLSNNSVMLSQTHPSAAILGRYNINGKWSLKGYFAYGRVSGADSLGSSDYRKTRNLSFYSDIYEFSAQVEFNLIKNTPGKNKLIPYIFGGIGVFNFNPKTSFQGITYELQPLGTEGQGTTQYNDREKYALTTICIPLGMGFKKKVGKHISVGIEFGVRITTTNYLDDVSGTYADARLVGASNGGIAQALSDRSWEKTSKDVGNIFKEGDARGYKSFPFTDMYFMGGLSFTYVFRNQGMKCPKF
jgi:hypothetical protein